MLKEILKEKGISMYQVSKGSGVPYTTLNELANGKKKLGDCNIKTIAAIASYLNMSIDQLYLDLLAEKKPVVVSQSWQEKRYKSYTFPLICPSANYDARKIHPLKQRIVKKLSDVLLKDERIELVVLFGGSTTIRCNKASDIDLAIKLKAAFCDPSVKNELSEEIQKLLNWNADIIWMEKIQKDSKLEKNIERGLRIV